MVEEKKKKFYRSYRVDGQDFLVYLDYDEQLGESFPAYPDFEVYPQYTSRGQPFVTAEQTICPHVKAKDKGADPENCRDCADFFREHTPYDPIGICTNEKRAQRKEEDIK